MDASSTHCRAQEARQLELAASATLENVRTIATNAAKAWHREALSADRREARRENARALAEQRANEAAALVSDAPADALEADALGGTMVDDFEALIDEPHAVHQSDAMALITN